MSKSQRQPTAIEKLLDYAATFQVPHNYFTHFYVVSVVSSILWGWKLQLWKASGQLQIVWALMLLQGARRLLESYAYTSSSKSKMWFAHWILGLLFYLATNIAIWIEGVQSFSDELVLKKDVLDWKTSLLIPAILVAHAFQHSYHAYLYRLRTQNTGYQLPSHPLFPNLLCPHYTCEIAIYALLSLLAAPSHALVNWTLICATTLVTVNLGVTALGARQWYTEKFGEQSIAGRKRMIPWIW